MQLHCLPRSDLLALALSLLGIAWAHAFLEIDYSSVAPAMQGTLRLIGQEADRLETKSAEEVLLPLAPMVSRGRQPQIVLHLYGMLVIHKPPDWEVDGKGRVEEDDICDGPLALSSWLRATLPKRSCPVSWMRSLDFGFLHRLDVPSSGLILCGSTITGLMMLRWQLDTYAIKREYLVFAHGLVPAEFRESHANIDPASPDSRRTYATQATGKPAKTFLKAPAALVVPKGNAAGFPAFQEFCTAFTISIHTGRRHQIRAHLLDGGHPVLVDGKYAPESVAFCA